MDPYLAVDRPDRPFELEMNNTMLTEQRTYQLRIPNKTVNKAACVLMRSEPQRTFADSYKIK